VHANGHLQFRGKLIDWKIIRMVERSPLEPVRPPEDARKAQLVFGAPQLFHCEPRVVQRDKRYPFEPGAIMAAIFGKPVVVGAAYSG
jgi:hypothetical protein